MMRHIKWAILCLMITCGMSDLANMTRDEIVGQYLKNYPDYAKVMQWFMTHGELMHVKREDVWEKPRS